LLYGRDNKGCFVGSPSTGTVRGLSQIPQLIPSEEQYLGPPSELVENLEKGEDSEEESYSDEELLSDILKPSKSLEGEQPVDSEYHIEIETFEFKSESSLAEEQELSTA
jgi:hypothetical protein